MRFKTCLFASAVMGLVGSSAQASILYSTAGSTYSQDFNSLPNTPTDVTLGSTPIGWTDDNAAPGAGNFSILGFHLYHPLPNPTPVPFEGGANGHQRMRIGAGGFNTGAFMSYGSTAATDRALGMLSSGTLAATGADSYYGARFTNNTGSTLVEFTLSYAGEQWRDGGAAAPGSLAQSITFDYSLNATSIQDALATFTDVPALDFTSPSFGGTVTTSSASSTAQRDGNLAANRTLKGPVTISGLNWLAGTDLWIRWTDINDVGNDHGLSVDDLTFSAIGIPEPGTFVLAGFGLLASLAVSRRRA